MEHSISDVARMAGVTSRTLRHYDQIGLLAPLRVSSNGYRWYGRTQLLQLQQILLLRELGVPLPHIQEIVNGQTDEIEALRIHRERLLAERQRIDHILATVDRTVTDLRGGDALDDAEFFAGLADGQRHLQDAVVQRYGDAAAQHFEDAARTTADWTRDDHAQAAADGRRVLETLSNARAHGHSPHSDLVLDLTEAHYAGVRAVWPADPAAYYAMADLIMEVPQQRDMIAVVDPLLPSWLAEAIRSYAIERLGYTPAG